MSNPIQAVTRLEFLYLLSFARVKHSDNNEPIPELRQENWDKIDYALHAPGAFVFGKEVYKGFYKKAAILFYLIAKGHRLVNGNKRMACVTLNYYCDINNRNLVISDESLYEMALFAANSNSMNKDECVSGIEALLHLCIKRNRRKRKTTPA